MGGERSVRPRISVTNVGSSPRGRGTPDRDHGCSHGRRFIPAWAGNARSQAASSSAHTVHPRVGGERARVQAVWVGDVGSSPRGRGTLKRRNRLCPHVRFIPAWAGNAEPRLQRRRIPPVHPRVGGERAHAASSAPVHVGSSPRGRGTLFGGFQINQIRRFIPAWAGNAAA